VTAGARRRLRQALWTTLALAGLALAIDAGLRALRTQRVERDARPLVDGEVRVAGLGDRLEVVRDARGIPHVEATGESDAWFGLGFVHAQDRLAQMVWLRASARGRAAELVGERALAADRVARVVGIGRLADVQAGRLEADTRAVLEAYAAGVNARMDRIRSGAEAVPVALSGLGVALEPWRPADSLAVVKLRAWSLSSSMRASLVLADLIRALGGLAARAYFPELPGGSAPPPLTPDVASGTPVRAGSPGDPARGGGSLEDPLRAAAGLAGHGVGSSVLVVGGAASESGRPIVAGDLHAEPTVPALSYEAHLRGGELDVAGVTVPGAPVFWSGHNEHVAWASSHEPAVVMDLFVETLSEEPPLRWLSGGRWRPLRERRERILVRGGEDEDVVVRSTGHGPLVNSLVGGDRPPLALAWTGALSGDGVGGFVAAARAKGAPELRRALGRHLEPVLAVAYGDRAGRAGIQLVGALPRRRLDTGYVPVPGRSGDWDWLGRIAYPLLPERSAEGRPAWAVASDARFGDGGEASGIEWWWRPGTTTRRLELLLSERLEAAPLQVRDVAALQQDVGSSQARDTARAVLALAGAPEALGAEGREVRDALARWDGKVEASSVGAAVYHVFLERLVRELLEARLGPELAVRYAALPQARPLDLVSELVRLAAEDPAQAGAVGEAVQRSLRETWLWLSVQAGANREKWAWGRLHPLRFRPFGVFPEAVAADNAAFGPFPYPGDGTTVSRGGYAPEAPFAVRVASCYRFAVDVARLDQALTQLVPGQSEHPGSPHLADAVAGWLAGRPRLLLTSPLLIEETQRSRLVLVP